MARHPEHTRRIACGRCAAARRPRREQGTPATGDVRGCTPTGRTTRHGQWTVRRTTSAPRLRQTRHAVKDTRRGRLPWPIPQQGAGLTRGLLGPYRSSAGPRHGSLLPGWRDTLMRSWCQTLRRRRQRHRRTGQRMDALAEPWLPQPPILHPYPAHRLCVTTRGRSPVRECRTPGSVRGVLGNRHPYRDRPPPR